MKKLVVVLIVAISLLSTLTSCTDYSAKADYEQETNNIGHDEVGDDMPQDDADMDW